MEALGNAWYGSWRPLTNLMQTIRVCHLCTFNVAAIFFGAIPTYGILPYAMIRHPLTLSTQEHAKRTFNFIKYCSCQPQNFNINASHSGIVSDINLDTLRYTCVSTLLKSIFYFSSPPQSASVTRLVLMYVRVLADPSSSHEDVYQTPHRTRLPSVDH